MTNPDDNFNPLFNNLLPPEFAHWSYGLDYDDDEFRAGYPFSDVQEMELNGSIFFNSSIILFSFSSRQSAVI